MHFQKLCIALLILIPLYSAETVSLVLGEQHNFTVNESQYAVAMIGVASDSATFTVSGVLVNLGVNKTKILDLNGKGIGDIGLTLDQIMQNDTVSIEIGYNVSGKACRPINESCSGFNDCCVGNCMIGTCSYPPNFNSSEIENATLNAPDNVTTGSIVTFRINGIDGKPIAGAAIDILTPSAARLSLATNENGEGNYLANEEGNYSYVTYGYLLSSNKTTLSSRSAPAQTPQKQPSCGDGVCNGNENCSTCPQDCGTCPVQAPATAQARTQGYSSLPWLVLMLLAILVMLRVLLPIFVRE
jgi:hypothetical protein